MVLVMKELPIDIGENVLAVAPSFTPLSARFIRGKLTLFGTATAGEGFDSHLKLTVAPGNASLPADATFFETVIVPHSQPGNESAFHIFTHA